MQRCRPVWRRSTTGSRETGCGKKAACFLFLFLFDIPAIYLTAMDDIFNFKTRKGACSRRAATTNRRLCPGGSWQCGSSHSLASPPHRPPRRAHFSVISLSANAAHLNHHPSLSGAISRKELGLEAAALGRLDRRHVDHDYLRRQQRVLPQTQARAQGLRLLQEASRESDVCARTPTACSDVSVEALRPHL